MKWAGRQERRSLVSGSMVSHDKALYVSSTYLKRESKFT